MRRANNSFYIYFNKEFELASSKTIYKKIYANEINWFPLCQYESGPTTETKELKDRTFACGIHISHK